MQPAGARPSSARERGEQPVVTLVPGLPLPLVPGAPLLPRAVRWRRLVVLAVGEVAVGECHALLCAGAMSVAAPNCD